MDAIVRPHYSIQIFKVIVSYIHVSPKGGGGGGGGGGREVRHPPFTVFMQHRILDHSLIIHKSEASARVLETPK